MASGFQSETIQRLRASVHTDDLYDIDDCLEIAEVDGQHIHLTPVAEPESLEVHSAYHVIPPEVVTRYIQRREKLA